VIRRKLSTSRSVSRKQRRVAVGSSMLHFLSAWDRKIMTLPLLVADVRWSNKSRMFNRANDHTDVADKAG
jgi:hypothetical protein